MTVDLEETGATRLRIAVHDTGARDRGRKYRESFSCHSDRRLQAARFLSAGAQGLPHEATRYRAVTGGNRSNLERHSIKVGKRTASCASLREIVTQPSESSPLRHDNIDCVEPRVVHPRHLAQLRGRDVGAIARASEPGPSVGDCTRSVGLFRDRDREEKGSVHGRECLD